MGSSECLLLRSDAKRQIVGVNLPMISGLQMLEFGQAFKAMAEAEAHVPVNSVAAA